MIAKALRIILATFLLSTSFALYAEPVQLTIDPQHSYVLWRINHLGFSTQSGKWFVNGTVVLDKDNPANSKVDISIDMNKLVTGIPELDKHLLGPQFFDAAKFPKATFVSDKVYVLSKTTAKVHGILTLHGVSKPIALNVTLNKVGKNPISDKDAVGFSAKTEFKRSDFGINTLIPQVGDEVKIDINAEAFKS